MRRERMELMALGMHTQQLTVLPELSVNFDF